MPFKHKLSKRLALIRARVVIAVGVAALGCDAQPTAPAADDVTVRISPKSVMLNPRQQVSFVVLANTSTGQPLSSDRRNRLGRVYTHVESGIAFHWNASGGIISDEGRYAASDRPGRYHVIVESSAGQADTAIVTVTSSAPTLARIVLKPETTTLEPGAEQSFAAYGRMTDGDSVAVDVGYVATGGAITADGRYTAGDETGTFHVIATEVSGVFADTSVVWINTVEPTLTAIAIEPKQAELFPLQGQQFSAIGSMSNGEDVPVNADYTASGGTVTPDGWFTAPDATGEFRVIATDAQTQLADTATVTVVTPPPVLEQVVLLPASAELWVGEQQQFSVFGRMSNGDSTDVQVTFIGRGGSITAGGLYTAGTGGGTYRVIATESISGLADTSFVRINVPIPELAAVVLKPSSAVVLTGGTQQFDAYGLNDHGDSVIARVNYAATGGSIDAEGLFTAGSTPGNFHVIATDTSGTFADTSAVQVNASAPTLASIVLNPASATLLSRERQQFSAYGVTDDGDSVQVAVDFSATGGSVDVDGLYTAGDTPGDFRVIAAERGGSLADTSSVTVTAAPVASVLVSPSSTSVTEGETVRLSAQLQDAAGNTLSGRSVTWSSSNNSVAQVSSTGLVTATTPGSVTITATSEGVSGEASVTVTSAPDAGSEIRAFPGAEGFGAYTSGGRGGRVIYVTNLNDGGPGSLREAVEASGPRTVVFERGGTITLNSTLRIESGDLTIAGQTAPGGGVTIRGAMTRIMASNVIIRFVRFRRGPGGNPDDALQIGTGDHNRSTSRVILDHVSVSWASDENVDIGGATDVTVQWSIIAEGTSDRGMRVGGTLDQRVSVHHNLFAHNYIRNPNTSFGPVPAGKTAVLFVDQRYNRVHNWGAAPRNIKNNRCHICTVQVNLIANVNTAGPSTKSGKVSEIASGLPTSYAPRVLLYHKDNMINGSGESAGNYGGNITMVGADFPVPQKYRLADDVVSQVEDRVLANAGVTVPMRDAVDERVVDDTRRKAGKIKNNVSEAGGWPDLPAGTPRPDRDRDGMPDAWETANGLNPDNANDRNGDRDGDGYTNLEEYLNALAAGI